MKHNESKIESMLQERQFPEMPVNLRVNVETAVAKRLRTQTFYDDLKWLTVSFGFLFSVIAGQYYLFSSTTDSLRDLTGPTISMVESGKPMKHRQSPALLQNDFPSSN
ncbi:MAG: hypothetical protein AB8B55_06995 [Mariniblastus sp.]